MGYQRKSRKSGCSHPNENASKDSPSTAAREKKASNTNTNEEPIFRISRLFPELRRMVIAEATNYNLNNKRRIIQIQLLSTWPKTRLSSATNQSDSPPGPYSAPTRAIRNSNRESRAQYDCTFPPPISAE